MPDIAVDPAFASHAAAAVLYAAFGLRLLFGSLARQWTGVAPRALTAATVASAAWAACAAATAVSAERIGAPLAIAAALLDILRYGLWFIFLLALLGPGRRDDARREIRLLWPVALGFTLLSAGTVALSAFGIGGESLAKVSLFAVLALPLLGLLLVEQLFRNLTEDSRWNAKPLCLALAVIFAFDLYIYSEAVLFGGFDRDALSVRGAIHALAVPLLFIAARRSADWIGKLKVSRTAAFYSATLLLAGVYLLLISGIGYYVRFFGGSWGRALQLTLLVSAGLLLSVLVLSGSARARLRVFVGKNFFSYRYDYREEWLRFTAMLSMQSSPQEMGSLVVRGLADLVESPGGSLWSIGAGNDTLVPAARWNQQPQGESIAFEASLADFLHERQWIIDVRELREQPERYPGLALPSGPLTGEQAWLIVPLVVADSLTGLVVLAPPRARVEVDWEVRDLLKTASRQAAVFLAQMQATEALLEARKFDAFNRMSAFVVHDLKNIVTQLTLMMRNARRLHDNPEFQQDMLMTVESSLEKMRQLMLQLREGEKPPGGLSGVDLAAIAQRIAGVAAQRGRQLELEVVERVSTRGHDERVERVIGHVVQNAFDATPPEGRVWLRLSRASGRARVEIGDTGQGMSREFVEHDLFRPFRSTKAGGMGIGSYESRQYVRELGGSVSVDSEPGRGTLVTIDLPLLETRHPVELSASTAR